MAHGVGTLDAVIPTHDHADAIFADDLRRSSGGPEDEDERETTRVYPIVARSRRCGRPSRTSSRRRRPSAPAASPRAASSRATAPTAAASARFRSPSTGAPTGAPTAPMREQRRQRRRRQRRHPAAARSDSVEKFGALEQARLRADESGAAVRRACSGCRSRRSDGATESMAWWHPAVLHGKDYVSYGFGFGGEGRRVVYLSDYTALLPATEALLARWTAASTRSTSWCSTRLWTSRRPSTRTSRSRSRSRAASRREGAPRRHGPRLRAPRRQPRAAEAAR